MLVVSRKVGESILLSDGVKVVLVAIDWERHKVRLGIAAPDHVKILREELVTGEESWRIDKPEKHH